MKVSFENIGGAVVRKNETYTVTDNTTLSNLTLSETILHPNKQTSGHSHDGLEEVYFFIVGNGKMKLDDDVFEVYEGDIVLIKAGVFHQVFNTGRDDLVFHCVFQKYLRDA